MSKTPTVPFWRDEMPELKGPWLGQPMPGDDPIELCAGVMSTPNHSSFGTAFSPKGDELLFATTHPETEVAHIVATRFVDGQWTLPAPVSFDSEWIDNDICMAPDGSRVAWRSWRPLPGETEPQEKSILWMADRTENGWSDAVPALCGGEPQFGGYPGIAADGTLYFAARHTPEECCVFRAERDGHLFAAREPIVFGMNAGGDMKVAPDQSFLVIACWYLPDNQGDSDLFVSFRRPDGTWTELARLGSPINNELNENCPMVSSDGERFLFLRYKPEGRGSRTYWMRASRFRALREQSV